MLRAVYWEPTAWTRISTCSPVTRSESWIGLPSRVILVAEFTARVTCLPTSAAVAASVAGPLWSTSTVSELVPTETTLPPSDSSRSPARMLRAVYWEPTAWTRISTCSPVTRSESWIGLPSRGNLVAEVTAKVSCLADQRRGRGVGRGPLVVNLDRQRARTD